MADVPTPAQPRVLFLAGIGRSGTTLLECGLAEHDDVVVLGETMHIWRRGLLLDERCSCAEPFSLCPFWQEVGRVAFGGWSRVSAEHVEVLRQRVDRVRRIGLLARSELRGPDAAAVVEYADYYRRIYSAAADLTGRTVVVDTSKQVSLALCLRHVLADRLRVLHCVRDSRAVAYAWTKDVRRPESARSDARMPRYSPRVLAGLWDLHNLSVRMLAVRGVPVALLRYEDFAARPAEALRIVASFAGLDPDAFRPDAVGESWIHVRPTHSAAGNPVRFRTGRTDVRLDDRWRQAMPRGQRALVTAMTWPLLRHYGYPLRAGRGAAAVPRPARDGVRQHLP